MANTKIFTALAVVIVVILGVYVFANPQIFEKKIMVGDYANDAAPTHTQTAPGDHPEIDRDANGNPVSGGKSSIVWHFRNAGELDGVSYTNVVVAINNRSYEMGKFMGSCSEIGANGGVDGKGLLAGELSAAQCWFAGSGDEIGVFAHEDGGFDIMVGSLSEGEEGTGLFRGDFKVKQTVEI